MPAAGERGPGPAGRPAGRPSPGPVRPDRPSAATDRSSTEARVRAVAARLEDRYGPEDKAARDPLDELVLTILSQNTTDTNRDRAWRALRDAHADWEGVRRASRSELEQTIRVAGLPRQKAAAIQGVLEALVRERGRPDLTHLTEMGDTAALTYLASFRGVGVKTAACVLAFALRRPILPVDTHVHRVARRLGLVPRDATRNGTHEVLNRTVPPDLRLPLHLWLIRLGRERCRARRPDCAGCPVADACPRIGVEAPA